ncbi:MAG: bifunctional adenosylcobinamide kinase/adenosylcobinamide-phosphate guanylyltransferase [bacterium]
MRLKRSVASPEARIVVAEDKELSRIVFITGGCRSGKSGYGIRLAESFPRRVFLATAQALDPEMEERIRRHRASRGPGWRTVEEPYDLAGALEGIGEGDEVVLIDCITLWLSNLLLKFEEDEAKIWDAVGRLLEVLREGRRNVIIISNEVGMGIVPDNPLARRFRDIAGGVNQMLAGVADEVVVMFAGLPIILKGGEDE